jgi:two-component system sensor histidine kinase MprB
MALIAAVAIGAAATAAYVLTSRELRAGVDNDLARRAQVGGALLDRPGRAIPRLSLVALADGAVQVLDQHGDPLPRLSTVSLPIDEGDRAIAAAGTGTRFHTVVAGPTRYRVLTVGGQTGERVGAVQIGRDLTESDAILRNLRRRLILVALLGTAAATVVGLGVAGGLVRPLGRLTAAAEHVARTQDLGAAPAMVAPGREGKGNDEVGRLAASFSTMLGALATSREQQRRLVMDASHELRTPLTSLRTNVELLRRAPDLAPADRDSLLADLEREVSELGALSAELVELATASHRDEEPVASVDLATLAETVAARYRRRSGRAISVTGQPTAVVTGRASQLERAITNLVDNAIKFSPAGEPVVIDIASGAVRVLDRGPGIPVADRPHVFDRFYRSVTSRDAPGSGLGLAIVADIVSAHGGSITVADAPGGGAAVGFTVGPPARPASS